MEPILVILLLFGAFTLGAESIDAQTAPSAEPISDQQPPDTEGRAATLSLKSCLSEHQPVIYRDLTIPFTLQQTALPAPHQSGCPDE